MTGVYGRSAFSNDYKVYKPINKENIRNSRNSSGANNKSEAEVVSGNEMDTINAVLNSISERYLPKFLKLDIEGNTVKLFFNIPREKPSSPARKMDSKTSNMMQYMIVPSFLMAGILPWVMPKLQMAVMMVSMLNNMIFSSALFSMVRSYVFEQEPDEHVIYINHGYRDKSQHIRHYGEHYT